MSPAAKTKKEKKKEPFKEHKVAGKLPSGASKDVIINARNGRVEVKWMTGTPVYFDPEDLKTAIKHGEEMRDSHAEVYLALEDSDGHPFIARIHDGRLEADGELLESFPNVSWAMMLRTLNGAIKFLKTPD